MISETSNIYCRENIGKWVSEYIFSKLRQFWNILNLSDQGKMGQPAVFTNLFVFHPFYGNIFVKIKILFKF